MAHDVFISYSTTDKNTADAVCATLEVNGIRCWIAPRDVRPGVPYGEALIDALNESRVMVLVFSSDSNNSPHVMREVERAVDKRLSIIPLRIEDVALSKSMEYFISAPQWLDALTPPLEKHLQQLADTIETSKQIHHAEIAAVGASTSKEAPLEDLNFRIDADLLRKHRKAFLRDAFYKPCIWELFLKELIGAIDDTVAALNTGSLYSRDKNLLSTFPDRGEYKTPEFKGAFREISKLLAEVKREALKFENFYLSIYPEYDFRYECFGMIVELYNRRPELRHHISQIFRYFDRIDALRNMILQELNTLLTKCGEEPFDLIELSSDEVRNMGIGNAELLFQCLYSTPPPVENPSSHVMLLNAYSKRHAKNPKFLEQSRKLELKHEKHVIVRRVLISLGGGALCQGAIWILAKILSSPRLASAFLFPGLASGFAGGHNKQSWSELVVRFIVVLGVNDLLYSSALYFFLWRRDVQREINAHKSFIKSQTARDPHAVKP